MCICLMDKEENVTAFSELTPGALDGCATNFSTTFNCKSWRLCAPLQHPKLPNNQHTGLHAFSKHHGTAASVYLHNMDAHRWAESAHA